MRARTLLRTMRREARGSRGRLVFFVLCLAVGVAAVVGVAGLSAGLEAGIRSRARALLGADLAVSGWRMLPPEVEARIDRIPGATRTRLVDTVSVVSGPGREYAPGASALVELRAVAGEFPFYGTLKLEPDAPLAALLDDESAVVGPELLPRLGLAVGETIRIGGARFRIAGTVLEEPDRLDVSFAVGPRVFVTDGGLERTALRGFGSRMSHRHLIRLADGSGDVDAVAKSIREALPEGRAHRVETYAQAQPALREALRRASKFLGLGALLSLLIGGIGVGQTVSAWLATRMDSIAILECLGMRPREVLALYLGQALLLAFAGSLVGAALGIGVQWIVPAWLGGWIEAVGPGSWQPFAVLRGLALGTGIAVVFSLPPLLAVLRVPPALVFRRDAEPLPGGRALRVAGGLAVAIGVFLTAWLQSGSPVLGAQFAAGLLVVFGALALAAVGVVRAMRALPRRVLRLTLRHGLAAVARPGAGTLGAIVALGLGVLVVLAMYLVQRQLGERLRGELPTDSPTAFFVDVQPAQWAAVREVLEEAGAARIESVPIVVARLSRVDGRDVEDLARERRGDRTGRWALTREQRLTYLETLPPDNVIVEGALWRDPGPEVSLEVDFARHLGAILGSTLTFDLQGVPIELRVTSLRTVEWRGFGINFFIVVEPGVLEQAPQARVAVARLPEGAEQGVQDLLAARFPNVVVIKIRKVRGRLAAVLDRASLGVRILGGFTVVAGIAILAGAVGAGSVRRGREVALLKTLGMTRGGVIAAFASEYALIGLVAGAVGAAGGVGLAWAVLTRGMELPWRFDAPAVLVAVAGAVVLAVAAGVAASLPALSRRPVEVLRAER